MDIVKLIQGGLLGYLSLYGKSKELNKIIISSVWLQADKIHFIDSQMKSFRTPQKNH